MWLLIDDERNLSTEAVARTAEAGRKLLAAGYATRDGTNFALAT